MKKIALILILSLIATGFAACGAPKTPDSSTSSVTEPEESTAEVSPEESAEEVSEEPSSTGEESTPIIPRDPLYVADAALYRGEVTEITEQDGITILTLEQVEGTFYGPPIVKINILEDTKANFDLALVHTGAYLEVFHGGIIATVSTEEINAIAINYLSESAAFRVFNGEVVTITLDKETARKGSFLMKEKDSGQEFRFNFDENGGTNFYMTFDDIKEGSMLNIYHGMAVTASLPPQIFALEVRPFEA